jgi:hypothetical protein
MVASIAGQATITSSFHRRLAARKVEVQMMELRLLCERPGFKSNSLADIRVLRIARLSFRNEHQRPFVC